MARKLPGKRRTAKRRTYERDIIIGIIIALLAIVLLLWGPFRKTRIAEEKKPPVHAKKTEPSQKKPGEKKDTRKPSEDSRVVIIPDVPEKSVFVSIVIDDLGQDIRHAQEILALHPAITVSIMPGLPNSKKTAELARQRGHQVLLHLPMEYRGKNGKPAPGMLRSDMTPMKFLNTISDDVNSVPGAVGANNHEGSLLTENKEAMKFLMAELKARDIFFLDSLTSPKSVAYATAKEFGLQTAKRDVFLDNEGDNPAYIRKQLEELTRIAKKQGKAIAIGHPHPATISELKKWIPSISEKGIQIVPVSKLMHW
ncbi:MAG: divergent polysaccharide deacetylase family protein [Nitrospirota bacterium]